MPENRAFRTRYSEKPDFLVSLVFKAVFGLWGLQFINFQDLNGDLEG